MGQLSAMFVNDFDTSGLGLIVEQVPGWLDGLSTRDRVAQLPTRVGAIILAPEPETAPRSLEITGVIKRPSLAACRAAVDELKERLYRGTVELRFADDLDKMLLARIADCTVVVTSPQFFNPYTRIRIVGTCPDPLRYDRYGSSVGFTTTRAPVPLGTAPSAPVIRIMGAATNPVLTLRDKQGVVRQTMTFTVTLAATDYLEIDCELFTITKYVSGVASNGITLLTAGDFLLLDPQDGDYPGSAWPTLELSVGTGEVLYRRAWL